MSGVILSIKLDETSVSGRSSEFEHEVKVAINDILHEHYFIPNGFSEASFDIVLKIEEQRLVFAITSENTSEATNISLSMQPLKRLIRDYFIVCDSYFEALKTSDPRKLEAIDMGRRGLHNEAAEELMEMLKNKIEIDFCTARRLFTLVAAMHM